MKEIKGSDIMIGNYFHVDGFPMYISGILNTTVYMDFNGNEAGEWEEYIKDLIPILLTEDILLKAGFKKGNSSFTNEYQQKIGDLLFSIMITTKGKFFFIPSVHVRWSIELNSLHQLQNLFKSLTGNELKINL